MLPDGSLITFNNFFFRQDLQDGQDMVAFPEKGQNKGSFFDRIVFHLIVSSLSGSLRTYFCDRAPYIVRRQWFGLFKLHQEAKKNRVNPVDPVKQYYTCSRKKKISPP
jgi:hypothetical protein